MPPCCSRCSAVFPLLKPMKFFKHAILARIAGIWIILTSTPACLCVPGAAHMLYQWQFPGRQKQQIPAVGSLTEPSVLSGFALPVSQHISDISRLPAVSLPDFISISVASCGGSPFLLRHSPSPHVCRNLFHHILMQPLSSSWFANLCGFPLWGDNLHRRYQPVSEGGGKCQTHRKGKTGILYAITAYGFRQPSDVPLTRKSRPCTLDVCKMTDWASRPIASSWRT